MNTPSEIKEEIYKEARDLLFGWYGQEVGARGDCLYWTQVAIITLIKRGFRPVMQAGSMLWPCAKDTGSNATHFGYEWTPDHPFSVDALSKGLLPEVHIWVALPDQGELIDFSTEHFKTIATRDHGLTWDEPDPPRYLWGTPPDRVLYRPLMPAIRFVMLFNLRMRLKEQQAA